jgi:putative transposase
MPQGRRGTSTSKAWLDIQERCLWPGQELYEGIRPVLMLEQPIKERAREIGLSPKTLSHTIDRFVQLGLTGMEPHTARREDDGRLLPRPIREHILQLKAEHPPLTPHELATICDITFERRVSHHTVQRVLARSALPRVLARRYARYWELPDGQARREAILRLHLEGWTTTRIAEYLEISRQSVTTFLRHRWVEEGVAGLPDKPRIAKGPRKVTLPVAATVKQLQETSAIGAHRMSAALKQRGIVLSPRTCGRIMALNREVYQLPLPAPEPRPKKPMPFAASRAHEVWSVDLRYIEHHQVPDVDGPIYIITILDNYSRSIVASAPSPRQDEDAYLLVLFTAIHLYGAPEALVSDGGGVFRSNKALEIYEQLAIRKERITPRRPWQNYVETHLYDIWNSPAWYTGQRPLVSIWRGPWRGIWTQTESNGFAIRTWPRRRKPALGCAVRSSWDCRRAPLTPTPAASTRFWPIVSAPISPRSV